MAYKLLAKMKSSIKRDGGKAHRKRTTFRQRVLLILFGLSLLAVVEIVLRLLPVGIESPAESDSFVGFSAIHPLFISYRAEDGSPRMKTAPGKLRWFNSQVFAAEKEPGTFRIFSLGGSTTYGRPYKDVTSFSGWLRKLLNRIPDSPMRYDVINAGGISYASYRVVKIIEELLNYEPDLIIVYTGHNEFLEARTYGEFLDQPNLVFKTREALSRLKLYRLLTRTYRGIRTKDSGGSETVIRKGPHILSPEVQTILDRSAGLDYYQRDTLFSQRVFEHFHYNVVRMKRLCSQAGVPLVFLEPVDNIKDFSPFKSQGRADLDRLTRERLLSTLAQGFNLLNEGRFDGAIERFKEAVTIDSLSADCFFFLGRAYLEAGDTATAVNYLQQARELDVCPLRAQEPIHASLRQETVGIDDPDLLDLPALFRQILPGGLIGGELLVDHIHPLPGGHLRIALALLEWMGEEGFVQGNYFPDTEELGVIYQEVMESLSPEYLRSGIINLAKVLIWAKKFREALIILEAQWELLAEEGEARYLVGSVLAELGAPQQAIEHFRKALELAPNHIMVIYKLAPLYSQLGEIDSSIAVYERALELYPDNIILLSDYGLLLGQLGQTDKALKLLLRAQRLEPDAPVLDNNLGTVYTAAGQYTRAIEAFRKAIDNTPQDPEPYYNLGNLYAILKNFEEAGKYFLEAIQRNPKHVGAHINLGNIYQNTGRSGLAEEQFRLALRLNPNLIAPYLNLAGLYLMTGRNNLARNVAQLGLQRFPEDSTLKKLVEESGFK